MGSDRLDAELIRSYLERIESLEAKLAGAQAAMERSLECIEVEDLMDAATNLRDAISAARAKEK